MPQARPGILLVDDDDNNTFTLERRLRQFLDADFTIAHNGRQALDALRQRRFDLVLMDIRMPEMDGLAALEGIRADMSLRDVPVIMISAVDDFETVIRCIKLGAEDYVQKPFNADLLRVDGIAAYVEYLRDPQDRGGEPLWHFGPLAEGMIAFLATVGLAGVLVVIGQRR